MKNIWETIKNFFGTVKNAGIAILILILIIAAFRGCSIYKNKIKAAAAAEQAEKDKKENEAKSKELQKQIATLLASVKEKDAANLVLAGERDDLKKERDKIKNKYTNFVASFSQLSQEGKDKELMDLLKRNGIDVQVVAADNYIKIMPPAREDLTKFVASAEKCEEEKDNLSKDLAKCDEQVVNLTLSETQLKDALEKAGVQCATDKDILIGDNNKLKREKKIAKKNAFWSKVGGVTGIVLTILLMK